MFFLQSTNKNRYKNNWGNKKTQCKIHVDHQHSIKIMVAFTNFDQFNTLFFGRWIIFSAMIYYNHCFILFVGCHLAHFCSMSVEHTSVEIRSIRRQRSFSIFRNISLFHYEIPISINFKWFSSLNKKKRNDHSFIKQLRAGTQKSHRK